MNIFKITFLLLSVMVISSCGDKKSKDAINHNTLKVPTVMQKNVTIDIEAGDSIVDSSEDAEIEIIVIGDKKTATLLEGNATILHQ